MMDGIKLQEERFLKWQKGPWFNMIITKDESRWRLLIPSPWHRERSKEYGNLPDALGRTVEAEGTSTDVAQWGCLRGPWEYKPVGDPPTGS